MRQESYSLSDVDQMIGYLDKQIAAGTDTPELLNQCQERLDALEGAFRGHAHFAEYYPRMLEVQALIFGRRSPHDNDPRTLQFMKEAVRQAGSVGALHSQIIKQYIAAKSQQPVHNQAVAHHQVQRQPAHHAASIHPKSSAVQQQMQQADHKKHHRKHASAVHVRPGLRKMKIAFAAGLGVLILGVVSFTVLPGAGIVHALTQHSQITADKQAYEKLVADYKACSSKLASERNSVNTNDMSALDAYNKEVTACQSIQQQQDQAADRYNNLVADK